MAETDEAFINQVDELADKLAALKVGDRERIDVMRKIVRLMPAMKEH